MFGGISFINVEFADNVKESALGNTMPLETRLAVHQVTENSCALMTGSK